MSPDTDVLILLMDLVSHGKVGEFTVLNFLTGKGAKYRSINVCERVKAVGLSKSQGLVGLHNFTGADWGGKFCGVSKKTWISKYLALPENDTIITAFKILGNGQISSSTLIDGNLPEEVRAIETFVCSTYCTQGSKILPSLRWDLFRTKNLEGEKLPPTRATLLPHIMRTNYIAMRDKSYTSPHP